MIETRKLNIGDLVYNTSYNELGMIISFDIRYIKFMVEWFEGRHTAYDWMRTQEMRNNYLDLRKGFLR